MKQMGMVAVLVLAMAAPGAARAQEWGSIKGWVKRSIADVIAKVRDPEMKAVLEDLRQTVAGLAGKLKGFRPQVRALVGWLAVAAAKAKAGAKAEDLKPLADKIKEGLGQIGKGGLRMIRDWIRENRDKFKGAAKVFKAAFKRGLRSLKSKVFGWWRKMRKQLAEELKKP